MLDVLQRSTQLKESLFFLIRIIDLGLPNTDLRKDRMVHSGWPLVAPPVLRVTILARPDVRMKRRRLALEQCLIVGMTGNTVDRIDSGHRRVAGGTVVFKRSVCDREMSRNCGPLPCVGLFETSIGRSQQPHQQKQRYGTKRNIETRFFLLFFRHISLLIRLRRIVQRPIVLEVL